jgi:hypothetical protein
MATKTRSREEITTTVQTLRAQIAAVQAETQAIATARVPLDEAEAALTAQLDQLASLYDVQAALGTFTRDPHTRMDAVEALIVDPRWDPMMYRSYEAAIHRDRLLAVWLPRLRGLYACDPMLANTIPVQERPARLEALRRTLYALEKQEELAICTAERDGVAIDRRPDVDVSIIFDAEVLAEGSPTA